LIIFEDYEGGSWILDWVRRKHEEIKEMMKQLNAKERLKK